MIPPTIYSKRNRDDEEREAQPPSKFFISEAKPIPATDPVSVFKCKICSKEFKTFQALGGHSASHTYKNPNFVSKKSSHECHICHKRFETGQALGGHMTSHREKPNNVSSIGTSSKSDLIHEDKSVGEGSRGDSSALVTRNLFPMDRMWVNVAPAPANVVPVLERADPWLELQLAPLGGDLNKRRD